VDRDAYVLALTRYVVLNPVRAGMVGAPEQWPWSSHRAMIEEVPLPTWLAVDALLSQFGPSRAAARRRGAGASSMKASERPFGKGCASGSTWETKCS